MLESFALFFCGLVADFGIARCRHSQVLSTGRERTRGGALGQMKLSVVFIDFSSLACILYSTEYVLTELWATFLFCYFLLLCYRKHQELKNGCCETIYKGFYYTSLANSVFNSRFRFGFGFGARYRVSLGFHFKVADVPFSFSWI